MTWNQTHDYFVYGKTLQPTDPHWTQLIRSPFHPFSQTPFPVATVKIFSVSMSLFLFCLFIYFSIPQVSETMAFVFLWLISCSIIPFRAIHVVANGEIHSFCVRVVHISLLLYPFIYWWTLMLLQYLGYCKSCCNEYMDVYVFLN